MRKKEVKDVIIKLDAPRMGRPRKDPDERHHTTLSIVGTIDEIAYIREQAKISGKSISRYIIEPRESFKWYYPHKGCVPRSHLDVLCCYNYDEFGVGYFDVVREIWVFDTFSLSKDEVVAWTPLPAPPNH